MIPPYLGLGLEQVRLRFRTPELQSRLHWLQGPQVDQPPFTVNPEIRPERSKSPSVEHPVDPSLEQYLISIRCLPTSSRLGSGTLALQVYLNRCS